MPEITSYPPGAFCWAELATSDRKAAFSFYSSLLPWTADEQPMGENPDDVYVMLRKDGKSVGALFHDKMSPAPPHWNVYVNVASVDESTEKAKSLGANVFAGPFDVMDVGRMSVISDPTGAVISLWEARRHHGAELAGETGAVCWFELNTPNGEPARQFYPALFGWNAKVSPEYTEWHLGEQAIGGMFEMQVPHSFWAPYFMVDDCDAFVEKARSLGAKIYKEPTDIPHVGRFSYLADPQGAAFAVIRLEER